MKEACTIVEDKLVDIQQLLNSKQLTPNFGDNVNHVFKVICGRGKHSQGGQGKIKVQIKRLLVDMYPSDSLWCDDYNGVYMIRLVVN